MTLLGSRQYHELQFPGTHSTSKPTGQPVTGHLLQDTCYRTGAGGHLLQDTCYRTGAGDKGFWDDQDDCSRQTQKPGFLFAPVRPAPRPMRGWDRITQVDLDGRLHMPSDVL